jgi:hypothetical protein
LGVSHGKSTIVRHVDWRPIPRGGRLIESFD